MSTRARLLAGSIATAVLVTTVQVATTTSTAAAAPVTCATSAKVFDGRADGSLWYYEHLAPATGAVSWSGGREIGFGFDGTTIAGRDGTVYYINVAGELRWYRYNGSSWLPGSGKLIGTGFTQQYTHPGLATVDSAGRLFMLQKEFEEPRRGTARMFRYDEATGQWDDPAGTVVQVGWQDYDLVAGAGDNVVYTRDYMGNLYRHRYDPASQRWTDRRRLVGTGWENFTDIFSPGGDVLYAQRDGLLWWYRFDAETGLWANGGGGRQIGTGWATRRDLSASVNSCTTATTAVAAANPLPATADDPIATVTTGADLRTFTLDAQGRVVVTTDTTAGTTTTTLSGPALTGQLSATPRTGGAQVAGLDAQGRVWHATFDGTTWSALENLGGNFRTVRAAHTTQHELALTGIDTEGRLWVRIEQPGVDLGWWHLPGPALTGEVSLAGSGNDLNGTAFRRDGVQTLFAVYPEAFEQDHRPEASYVFQYLPGAPTEPVAVTPTPDLPRLYAHYGTSGQVRATRWTSWTSLPDQQFAPGQPLSAVYVGEFNSAVAGRGPDGRIHVSSQASHLWDDLQPWQTVGTFSTTAPTITYGDRVELTYRGQDGLLYRYSADATAVGGSDPLQFTGGPIGG